VPILSPDYANKLKLKISYDITVDKSGAYKRQIEDQNEARNPKNDGRKKLTHVFGISSDREII